VNWDTPDTWPARAGHCGGDLAGRPVPGWERGRRLAGNRRDRPRPWLASPIHVSY